MTTETSKNKDTALRSSRILSKLRDTLLKQKTNFNNYLLLAEKETSAIEEQNTDKLEAFTKQEKNLVTEIVSSQKVINALTELNTGPARPAQKEINNLYRDIEAARQLALEKNRSNRKLLRTGMDSIAGELGSIKKNLSGRNLKTQSSVQSLYIDISG